MFVSQEATGTAWIGLSVNGDSVSLPVFI